MERKTPNSDGHDVRIWETRNAYRVLVRNLVRKQRGIKVDFKGVSYERTGE